VLMTVVHVIRFRYVASGLCLMVIVARAR
jgi:hypothetical protein